MNLPATASDPDEAPTTPPDSEGPAAFNKAEVQELFDTKCVRCHSGTRSVLDLSDDFSSTTVEVPAAGGRAACADSTTRTRIVPGDREGSLLWQKVNGTQDCGDPMPPPGKGTKLTAMERERLGLYIDALK